MRSAHATLHRMGERGQATVEWVGAILLVALVLVAAAVVVDAGWLPPRLLCVISGQCARDPLAQAYGDDVGALVRRHAPSVVLEQGEPEHPSDFRACRAVACSRGPRAVAFTHVVDHRSAGGDLFVQYWLYYPTSAWISRRVAQTVDALPGIETAAYHEGDWESYQVRIGRDGRVRARASSHQGYTGHRSRLDVCEAGIDIRALDDCDAWEPATGFVRVSRGSHAGHLVDSPGRDRVVPGRDVALVPYEPLVAAGGCHRVGPQITMPDCKGVYADPTRDDT